MSNYYLQKHFQKKIFNYLDFKNLKIEDEISNFDIFILPQTVSMRKILNITLLLMLGHLWK